VPDPVIGAVERFLNAQLAASTPARRQVDALAGRQLGIVLVGPAIELVLTAEPGRLRLRRAAAATADASVAGTPLALLEALRAGKSGIVGQRAIVVSGDVQVLESFSELLRYLRPDVEEALAGVVGDIVAHESVRFAAAVGAWGRRALEALALNSGEYLQEESQTLPARHEVEAFARDVEALRDAVERVAARLSHLEARRSAVDNGSAAGAGSD